MSGQKITVVVSKAGRNKNKNIVKKNKNMNPTLSLPESDGVPAGTESSLSGTPSTCDSGMEVVQASTRPLEPIKCKKRNKSVTITDENEAAAPKKPKTDETQESRIFVNSQLKLKKNSMLKDQVVEEHMESTLGTSTSSPAVVPKKLKRKAEHCKPKNESQEDLHEAKCARKKTDDTNKNQDETQRKYRHQKRQAKMDAEDETAVTMHKRLLSSSEEELNQVLGNMHIENNVFGLTNTVNETAPSTHIPRRPRNENIPRQNSDDDPYEFDLDKVVRWTRSNWDKDSIDAMTINEYNSSVVIENLPSVMTPVYKEKLMNLFEKYGHIINIGPVNMQPCDGDAMPTFNTTLYFDSEEAAINALDEDNTHMGGVPIRVRRPLPAMDPVRNGCCRYNHPIGDNNTAVSGSGPVRAARLVPDRASGISQFDSHRDKAAPFAKERPGAVLRGLVSAIIEIKG